MYKLDYMPVECLATLAAEGRLSIRILCTGRTPSGAYKVQLLLLRDENTLCKYNLKDLAEQCNLRIGKDNSVLIKTFERLSDFVGKKIFGGLLRSNGFNDEQIADLALHNTEELSF